MKGAVSFEQLRTVDGQLFPTFKAACIHMGLLEDDQELEACLEEAAVVRTGSSLRQLFATILLFSVPQDPLALWEKFLPVMTDDLLHRARQVSGCC